MPLVCALICVAPLSEASAAELPVLAFSMKPRICVLTEEDEMCYDELEVQWQSDREMSLCLYRKNFEKPLNCWNHATSGHHRFVLATAENVTFFLREQDHGLEVSEAFEVIHDHKQYRRARRNPWSFF